MKKVEVFGTGCPSCLRTEEVIRQAATRMGWVEGEQYVIEKVQKMEEIVARGVLSTPGVAVDGVLKFNGKVPSHSMVQGWLAE